MLCENALRLAEELEQRGIEVFTGSTGGKIHKSSAAAMAWPAALPLLSGDVLPDFSDSKSLSESSGPQDQPGILILAMPRLSTGNTALDRFLQKFRAANEGKKPELFFLYSFKQKKDRAEAAVSCTAFYKRHAGIIVNSFEIT